VVAHDKLAFLLHYTIEFAMTKGGGGLIIGGWADVFFCLFFVHELKIVRQQDDVKTKRDAARVVAGYHC